ncbi:MAG: chemotaxis protein CheB, partial [Thermoleophilaceae bacterium]|nr:chemotaxis protein CheB [Thermoleophilaceae bacterium]
PASAERPEMPAAAIASGAVDHVLSLAGIAKALRQRFVRAHARGASPA